MATNRFIKDSGLTARMTLVMFLLGALFVGLVVGMMYAVNSPGLALLIGVGGIGVAFYQWWSSDKMAMRAMRAREVTPEEAPELHGMIDRLCALADMPKPRVGIADMDLPNAFATGRSPDRSVVCVTTGILGLLDAEELEAVLAHELSHVAHRDVLVMTIASSAGIARRHADARRPVRWPERAAAATTEAAPGSSSRSSSASSSMPSASSCYACSRATASCAPTGRAPTSP